MKLLCHRGLWREAAEKNSPKALRAALAHRHGIETDVRDLDGELVVSHDPPRRGCVATLVALLEDYHRLGSTALLALNVKSDGLQQQLHDSLHKFGVTNYFVFDMSVPDTLGYLRAEMPIAARLSEYERGNALLEEAKYLWLDAFHGEWYSKVDVVSWLEREIRVCVVSPELHRRAHLPLWQQLRTVPAELQRNLYLCTDLFDEASEAFDLDQD